LKKFDYIRDQGRTEGGREGRNAPLLLKFTDVTPPLLLEFTFNNCRNLEYIPTALPSPKSSQILFFYSLIWKNFSKFLKNNKKFSKIFQK
jgi:hypothetical protein